MSAPAAARRRMIAWGIAGFAAVALLWEAVRLLGPADGVTIGAVRVLPRATDLAMPHVWDMIARLIGSETASSRAEPLWLVIAQASATTLGIAAVGLLVGLAVGVAFAIAMLASPIARMSLLPWIVLSQTVPLIAFAPLVRSIGAQAGWTDEMSVAVIASYLAFFPVAVGALSGFDAPDRIHVELMRTYGVGWWGTLLRLRLPAAVPHLLTALRLAAAGAIVGTVVAEVSTGMRGGLGRLVIQFAGQASSDPPKAWAPVFGAIVLGLVAAATVAAAGGILKDFRRVEASA
ncbi:ABC transporter permease [Microbacterium karelineae]|uniref:ABC transporter permease n=1 Tax=Microbacterium karelineae TaxID=2654283 RepID=UPI001E3C5CA0|nr:ABC transporter permease subunit [Microbacterium karelineae]